MPRTFCTILLLLFAAHARAGDNKPPIHLWFEPEWFEGVKGSFAYWTGTAKPTGSWGVAGPGISAEWTQGGESEWNSMGAPADETKASCRRDFIVPRAGNYKVWVRYVDHRHKTEPFRVSILQNGKTAVTGEFGVQPVVPPNDEYQLWWGFSFGWGVIDGKLTAGPAQLQLLIERPGEAWRQIDAVLITDDAGFVPNGRAKPTFAYESTIDLYPKEVNWRGTAQDIKPSWQRPKVAGRDFSMWTGVDADPKWWGKQPLDKLSLYDVYFELSPPADIKAPFHKQFAGRKDVPILSWPNLLPGFYLGGSPDLSPGAPLRVWLERTKAPFYILTNYASGNYNDKTGPATYAALTGPLAEQFLGFIHGEALGTGGVSLGTQPLGKTRREHVNAVAKSLRQQQAEAWSKIFKTPVAEHFFSRGISCLSVDSIALAHLFQDAGCKTVGYEIDATNAHAPMRIAFERGAARQYGGAWINYASGNFGDACNYFSQKPVVERGAPAWFHSKYSITDGVSAAWYRKLYYLNYLGGASAIYWEQNLANQWILPGPGTHPIDLSPFGRGTVDFQSFVDRLPDRGEPVTPVAFLLSYAHAYERVNYACKMLHVFQEDSNDVALRELFNVAWYPAAELEGKPAAPDVQSIPGGVYGNIFDILVDRPAKGAAILNYPVVWVAGDADLSGAMQKHVEEYLRRGGTLVVNITAASKLPRALSGVEPTGKTEVAEQWFPDGATPRFTTPFDVVDVTWKKDARVLAWAKVGDKKAWSELPVIIRHDVGAGAVIVTTVPHLLGQDERAHPALPYLMNGLTSGLLPVEVRLASGARPRGEIMYQLNKTNEGYLVTLVSCRGIDKTQTGLARVDRTAYVDVVLRTPLAVKSAREYTQPRDLAVNSGKEYRDVRVRVHPGDVQVVSVVTK